MTGRAGPENLIGEANREGLGVIPSKKFESNKAPSTVQKATTKEE